MASAPGLAARVAVPATNLQSLRYSGTLCLQSICTLSTKEVPDIIPLQMLCSFLSLSQKDCNSEQLVVLSENQQVFVSLLSSLAAWAQVLLLKISRKKVVYLSKQSFH